MTVVNTAMNVLSRQFIQPPYIIFVFLFIFCPGIIFMMGSIASIDLFFFRKGSFTGKMVVRG